MAVPKKKTSTSKRNMRRAHDALKKTNIVTNSKTGEYQRPHHISLKDGFYKGKQVVRQKESKDSKED